MVNHSSIKSLTALYSDISLKSGVLLKACQENGSFCSRTIAPTRGSNMKFVFGVRWLKKKGAIYSYFKIVDHAESKMPGFYFLEIFKVKKNIQSFVVLQFLEAHLSFSIFSEKILLRDFCV